MNKRPDPVEVPRDVMGTLLDATGTLIRQLDADPNHPNPGWVAAVKDAHDRGHGLYEGTLAPNR